MPISFNLFYDAWRPHGCYNMPTPLEKTTKHHPIMEEIFQRSTWRTGGSFYLFDTWKIYDLDFRCQLNTLAIYLFI